MPHARDFSMTIGVGIIGYGFMGRIHAAAYAADRRAAVVAIADARPDCLRVSSAGNLISANSGTTVESARLYRSADELLTDPRVDAVSICVPTPEHRSISLATIRAGKHALIEKPLARTIEEAAEIEHAAVDRPELVCMPAMCMRFWPGWSWLKQAIDSGAYGRVLSATFTRLGAAPGWSTEFYRNPAASGGAVLDLHIHDVDFIRFCFGQPRAVASAGVVRDNTYISHITTNYEFNGGPELVRAEGGWLPADNFTFTMQYRVCFERAVAEWVFGRTPPLCVYEGAGESKSPAVPEGDGYRYEVQNFLDCIECGEQPTTVTLADGVAAIKLIELERKSVMRHASVEVA